MRNSHTIRELIKRLVNLVFADRVPFADYGASYKKHFFKIFLLHRGSEVCSVPLFRRICNSPAVSISICDAIIGICDAVSDYKSLYSLPTNCKFVRTGHKKIPELPMKCTPEVRQKTFGVYYVKE